LQGLLLILISPGLCLIVEHLARTAEPGKYGKLWAGFGQCGGGHPAQN